MSVDIYEPHSGSVRVSGGSPAKAAGMCGYHFFKKKQLPVDFYFMGGNAGLQAAKACSVLAMVLKEENSYASFIPMRFKMDADDGHGNTSLKDIFVWRLKIEETDDVTELGEDIQHI